MVPYKFVLQCNWPPGFGSFERARAKVQAAGAHGHHMPTFATSGHTSQILPAKWKPGTCVDLRSLSELFQAHASAAGTGAGTAVGEFPGNGKRMVTAGPAAASGCCWTSGGAGAICPIRDPQPLQTSTEIASMVAALVRTLVQQCHDVRRCELETLALFGEAWSLPGFRNCSAGGARPSSGPPATTCMAAAHVWCGAAPLHAALLASGLLFCISKLLTSMVPDQQASGPPGGARPCEQGHWTCQAGARFAACPAQGRHGTGEDSRMGRPRRFQRLPAGYAAPQLVRLPAPAGLPPTHPSPPHMHQPLHRRQPTEAQGAC